MKNSNVKFHIARPRGIFAAFVLASAMGSAPGQTLTAPATPAIITPHEQPLFLVAPAIRTQGYICLPTAALAATGCPNAGAMPSLVLESVASQPTYGWNNPLGDELHSIVEHSCDGVAPPDECSSSADVTLQTLVPYSADYYCYPTNK